MTLITPTPRCDACGYELDGLLTNRCPECGEGIWDGIVKLNQRRVFERETRLSVAVNATIISVFVAAAVVVAIAQRFVEEGYFRIEGGALLAYSAAFCAPAALSYAVMYAGTFASTRRRTQLVFAGRFLAWVCTHLFAATLLTLGFFLVPAFHEFFFNGFMAGELSLLPVVLLVVWGAVWHARVVLVARRIDIDTLAVGTTLLIGNVMMVASSIMSYTLVASW